jgi:hypothetical protein
MAKSWIGIQFRKLLANNYEVNQEHKINRNKNEEKYSQDL